MSQRLTAANVDRATSDLLAGRLTGTQRTADHVLTLRRWSIKRALLKMSPGVRIAAASARQACAACRRGLTPTSQHAGPSRLPMPLAAIRPAHTSTRSETSFAFPTHTNNPTPYEIFHFSSRAVSQSEIKARYYDLVRALHPDRFAAAPAEDSEADSSAKGKGKEASSPKSRAHEQFKMVVDAYNLLKDPRKKQVYDRSGIGWDQNGLASDRGFAGKRASWQGWQDNRYRSRANGHDRYGWQTHDFYSNHYTGPGGFSGSAGWNGGNGQFASNGRFISSLFLLTWILAGIQYGRLSLQSQKALEKADRNHSNAALSLQDAREQARSDQGRARLRAFRRRAREQRTLDELDHLHVHAQHEGEANHLGHAETLLLPPPPPSDSRFGLGHGGPSGKEAAQERFHAAQTRQ